jgi:hypothetical protein
MSIFTPPVGAWAASPLSRALLETIRYISRLHISLIERHFISELPTRQDVLESQLNIAGIQGGRLNERKVVLA